MGLQAPKRTAFLALLARDSRPTENRCRKSENRRRKKGPRKLASGELAHVRLDVGLDCSFSREKPLSSDKRKNLSQSRPTNGGINGNIINNTNGK